MHYHFNALLFDGKFRIGNKIFLSSKLYSKNRRHALLCIKTYANDKKN